ncbi:unnamed protein product [Urochloa humidicola]
MGRSILAPIATVVLVVLVALIVGSLGFELLRHLFSSEPPTGSWGAALLPAGDDFINIFSSPVKLRPDVALSHLSLRVARPFRIGPKRQ